jgi:hypothetical protein
VVLTDEAIARYARQIVIPGIGATGQEKLLASTVLVCGNARGCEQAALYLRAAGVRVVTDARRGQEFQLAVVADASCLDDSIRSLILASGGPACWYTLEEGGFSSGIHPAAPLPIDTARRDLVTSPIHDVAACDAAALACAVLVGLACGSEPEILET